ncbi:extracellular solute-binding protein [Nocardioides sp. W7]|uniref:ABC transporter substrate-binding protein n=1 Tax=Nocardioides sp. W7 TaxID=2931390 RepID=UPI001FD26D38|nr:extracellular solute-binding protein [Nocardioides sp. W7]
MTARRVRRVLAASVALTVSLGLAACDSESAPDPDPTPSTTAPVQKTRLTFGVFGNQAEIAAYESMVAGFNETSELSQVEVQAYADNVALEAAVRAGGKSAPDVFLADRDDLVWLREGELNTPVDELLDERGIEFGDQYSRAALEAFSAERRLQCMPYAISPTVIFYNTQLVNFERMTARGLQVPSDTNNRWSFDQFEEAARFASRKRRGSKGVHIEPTTRALAPFIYSGGGKLFDDEEEPTSLAYSDESSREALTRTLALLRDPTVTLSEKQLQRRTPLEWFERGKLGMIAGSRALVPELREVEGLRFDVLPMPTLDSPATVGDITGACIASGGASVPEAADFLIYALSTEAVRLVARSGYLVPVNQEVALTDDFLQPDRQPEHAAVFTSSIRALRIPPLLDVWPALDQAVTPLLDEMFSVPVLDDLEDLTTRIDEASRTVLDPEDPADEPEDTESTEGSE